MINTASTGLANIWAMAVAVVSLPLLLRGLGRDAFGTWVLLQTFSAVTGWVSLLDLGVGTATTKAVAERLAVDDRTGLGTAISSALAVFAVMGVGCAAVLGAAGPMLLPSVFQTPGSLVSPLRFAIVMFALQTALDLVTEGMESALEGLQRVDLSRVVDAVRRTAVAATISVVALAGGGLKGVAVASLLASATGSALGAAVTRRELALAGADITRPSGETVRELLRYGRAIAVLRPIGVIHRTMDRVIAGAVLGPGAVTLVEIATQVQNGADAVLSASAYAVVPSASWLGARRDLPALRELLERGTRYSLLVTAPVAAGAAVLCGPLVRVWVGSQYDAAAGLAAVALLYIALVGPVQVGSNLLLGTGRARDILRAALAAVVVNLICSVLLVHAVGIVGVFLGTLVGTCALVPLLTRAFLDEVGTNARTFLVHSIAPILPPLAALVAAAGLVVALPLSDVTTLAVGTLAGAAAYVAAGLATTMPPREVAELLGPLRRALPSEEPAP